MAPWASGLRSSTQKERCPQVMTGGGAGMRAPTVSGSSVVTKVPYPLPPGPCKHPCSSFSYSLMERKPVLRHFTNNFVGDSFSLLSLHSGRQLVNCKPSSRRPHQFFPQQGPSRRKLAFFTCSYLKGFVDGFQWILLKMSFTFLSVGEVDFLHLSWNFLSSRVWLTLGLSFEDLPPYSPLLFSDACFEEGAGGCSLITR